MTRFSLMCIGEFPGVPNFAGLGQLEPSQLAPLLDRRAVITDAQIELGRGAWDVFTGTDPMALDEFARRDTRALPFLEGAVRRHLEDFPGTRDGLSRSERQILRAPDRERRAPVPLFRATQGIRSASSWAI